MVSALGLGSLFPAASSRWHEGLLLVHIVDNVRPYHHCPQSSRDFVCSASLRAAIFRSNLSAFCGGAGGFEVGLLSKWMIQFWNCSDFVSRSNKHGKSTAPLLSSRVISKVRHASSLDFGFEEEDKGEGEVEAEAEGGREDEGAHAELQQLLKLLPKRFRKELEKHPDLQFLVEIVMDLGRRPFARFPSGDWPISDELITASDLHNAVSWVGEFTDDNRTGINRTLHRISAIHNREGCIIGLTCRVGRAISGSAEMVRDLVSGGGSLLLMGPPGVGKTTAIREIARMLANEYDQRVVIVDTSNEIGGDGDIPHPGIGRARRMQVANVEMQHKVMIEAVENHMPQTIVVDEIGTELEALAAVTIAQRGVQLVATAHGMTVENLIKNPSLEMLVGGIQSVTLGDEEARRRGVQKSVLERKGPSTFTTAVEMISRTEWRSYNSLEATVDALLAGRPALFEVRKINDKGELVIANKSIPIDTEPTPGSTPQSFKIFDQASDFDRYKGEEGLLREEGDESMNPQKPWEQGDAPLLVYTFQISEDLLEQVMEVMELEQAINLTNNIGIANVILALRSELKQNSWVKNMARFRQLPIYAIKANTMAQMVRALRAILGFESLGATSLLSEIQRKGEEIGPIIQMQNKRPTFQDEIDALEEVRLAIETIVIPKGQPVELLPRSSEVISLQSKMIQSYQLTSEKSGIEPHMRLRILPLDVQDQWKTVIISMVDQPQGKLDIDGETYNNGSAKNVMDSGTSVSRLPILPD
ncbi:hypothetical protein O6H91_03G092800 [Diphasiastrum complanatum]|uniref:Uncharacterized protein n=1 Tax=Diphasiastrum complanatum TaxID=34168 RepID=A0ACC2E936_DIPCM|nr:hypothetical protein O6H91_03G092800 [Diphasiastrum complanatum]